MSNTAKVSHLRKVPKYNHQVVDHLETLLALAKNGEVLELIATVKYDNGLYGHSWTGCENMFELVGVLERQKLATLRRMDTD
ncbi:MAG: hypothetical protein A2Y38_18740 [Spirochaetes bacterium GWB1_59_5]|nr:MAG: hypothetical protein A2Y38_18740 [Spirochaetes bacterium GWB1_59_5]